MNYDKEDCEDGGIGEGATTVGGRGLHIGA